MKWSAVLPAFAAPALAARSLPSPVVAGYTFGDNTSLIQGKAAVDAGVNLLIHTFMELVEGAVVPPKIGTNYRPHADYTANLIQHAFETGKELVHLVSIGGWGAPHKYGGSQPGSDYVTSFQEYNRDFTQKTNALLAAQCPKCPVWAGFDGVDFDIEGVDEVESDYNVITETEAQVLIDFAKGLHAAGFLVSMAPPESYFDCGNPDFNMKLNNPVPWKSDFHYAGKNFYALLYMACPDCFSLVIVQTYEGWARTGFNMNFDGDLQKLDNFVKEVASPATDIIKGVLSFLGGLLGIDKATGIVEPKQDATVNVLANLIDCLVEGWTVNFTGSILSGPMHVSLPASKIALGLPMKWAKTQKNNMKWDVSKTFSQTGEVVLLKFPFFSATTAGKGFCASKHRTRGLAYWAISHQGWWGKDVYPFQLVEAMVECVEAWI